MSPHLQSILDKIRNADLPQADKEFYLKSINEIEKSENLLEFKFARSEKDRYTLSVMLEESIEDLQKKSRTIEEANAALQNKNHELEIEAALERVRARAMAMNSSEELSELVTILFEELVKLDLVLARCIIWIFEPDTLGARLWMANSEDKKTAESYYIKKLDHPYYDAIVKGWKERDPKWVYDLKGDDKRSIDQLLLNETELSHLPEAVKQGILKSEHTIVSGSFNNFGLIEASGPIAPTEEQLEILNRFGKVFDLSYTRFNDLKQAEAQAREAQIQLALERVRARTMAMQKSDELTETSLLLFEQFRKLGETADQITIGTFHEEEGVGKMSVTIYGSKQENIYKISLDEPIVMKKVYSAWKSNERSILLEVKGKELGVYNNFRNQLLGKNLYPVKVSAEERWIVNAAFFSKGFLSFSSSESRPKEIILLLQRFAGVFDLTYTRFLDLKKAEAQARESQIQLALERIRARTMAMQKSDELEDIVKSVFERLADLNIEFYTAIIVIFSEDSRDVVWWLVNKMNQQHSRILIKYTEVPYLRDLFEAKENGKELFSACYSGDEKNEFYKYLLEQTDLRSTDDESKKFLLGCEFATMSVGLARNIGIHLTRYSNKLFSEEENEVLKRFARVFDQAYTRFLDLQKAEAQAREAQIEAALERVRSKAMAMHKSEDFNPAVAIVFEELEKLDLGVLRCGISVLNKEKRTGDVWVTSTTDEGSAVQVSGDESFDIHPLLAGAFDAWLHQEDYSYLLEGDDLTNYYKAVKAAHFQLPESQFTSTEMGFRRQFMFVAAYHAGGLFAFRETDFPDEAKKVMKRFANVFDLTYKRFVDLQNAEAQAKEAQIEAALERVRARAMAMHTSDDLQGAVTIMFEEFKKLNLDVLRCGIGIMDKDSRTGTVWATSVSHSGLAIQISANENFDTHPLMTLIYDYWQKQEDLAYVLKGKDLIDYYKAMDESELKLPKSQVIFSEHDLKPQYYYAVMFNTGGLYAFREKPFVPDDVKLMKRFASVVDLTYKRFLDLQKAEAQAREATIEAALERVRGKAMAMHDSNDLSVTASMVFTELRKLGINPIRSGVGLLTKESRKAQLYSATSSPDGDSLALVGWVMLSGHPVLEQIYDTWMNNEDCYPELSGEQLRSYYELLLAGLSVPFPDWQSGQKQYGHFLSFSIGCLYAWSETPYNDVQLKILKRFAAIIDLTFRRYVELQQSEAIAKEAVKQAALDRIRADIASMRTTDDLDRITPLIWSELTTLGISFIRCGVFIMDEKQKLTHTFLSTPDGRAIAAFHLPFDSPGNVSQVLAHWREKKNYIDHWDELAFTEFANTLVKQGALASSEQYLKTLPPGGFYLHFIPFLQGMLYVGNTTQLGEEQINLIHAVADAFSTAYARYEDFNNLEAAKHQIEKTLVDLKQTQVQLVQSEKMASLGELTAGIAHEIQNPLNFVNNFSEVSNELLDEMKAELATGNREQAIQIAEDVKQNLDKILHHGKRADAIVKGMLQHSRTSSGQKEPTDINALADEYLRLAYHGLRAKDKTFNAKFEASLDPSIAAINVVPQEIGRVILNLINNAFYAVTEKKKQLNGTYEPTVSVSTRRVDEGDKIEIIVKDNGNGVPRKILDKIFQPFFTTKPTGQGTGLGLSLSYDIITKGHGGELKVNTVENTGSEFIITLPT